MDSFAGSGTWPHNGGRPPKAKTRALIACFIFVALAVMESLS
uniref:Uncharacterized protein n=1 Tax=Peronospora matthiolae TaxID=2874970 RepID=A0AAV1TKF1_9STRA